MSALLDIALARPGDVIGFRKNGSPIRLAAGGSETPPETPVTPPPGFFTAEQLEAARQQEKDKLYGRIEKQESAFKEVQEELAALRKEREEREALAAQQRKEADEAARRQREEDMSAKELLAQKEQEWRAELARIESEREQEKVLREKESEMFRLQAYIQSRVAQESEHIAPELLDLVSGNTPEEVEASITSMKERTARILEGISQAQTDARANMRGVSATGYAPTGPMDTNPAHQQYSLEDLKNMPISEYAKIRGKLVGSSQSQGNYGLFG